MASKGKRDLYKPAQKSVPKRNRKPLAQGRLVTEPVCNIVKKTLSGAQVSDDIEDHDTDTLSVTPSKLTPSYHDQVSPQPTSSLDLSDIDTEVIDDINKSVIVMDATENLLNPENSAEVSVNIGMKKSPVRVVCHLDTDALRERNDNVVVEKKSRSVTKVKQSSTLQAISPLHKDRPKSASKGRTPVRKIAGTPSKIKPNYPQPNFNDSDESGSMKGDIEDDLQSIISETDTVCSIDEYIPVIKSKALQNQKTSSKGPKMKMKTAPTIIPSRYLQVSSKSSASFNEKPTSRVKKSSNKSLPVTKSASNSRTTPTLPRKNLASTTVSNNQQQTRAVTPSQLSSQAGGGKTSTPCPDNLPNQTQDIDASAIHAEISAISADLSAMNSTRKVNSPYLNRKQRPNKKDIKSSQQRLEVLYSRYLQWLYLDSKSKMVFKEQEKTAMSQLNALWEEVESLREKESALRLDLVRLQHLNQLDDQLEIQKNGLGPVMTNLPVIDKDYNKLAESLDTTRHQISTRGIYIPEDEDTFQAALESSLKESEYLLGEISCLVRQEVPKTSLFSKSLQTTQKLVDTECTELKKCTELLSAIQSLTVQESSLKIQAIQSS
ncbi:hypothetical protein LOTGIDRAFT_231693 [Lottia gigantea]|uniref:Uncharacterized protein n=1 Tax=Lottia gigantea TaxID=225164 RepID=V4AT34_LOTGI|nr:hypothetical protein LOTGIDRAFT_231693 [Lottia gigantea]ESO96871.1 hypothetical protein LOTGIDRAFT_231693 [Lottia gigantea]